MRFKREPESKLKTKQNILFTDKNKFQQKYRVTLYMKELYTIQYPINNALNIIQPKCE